MNRAVTLAGAILAGAFFAAFFDWAVLAVYGQ